MSMQICIVCNAQCSMNTVHVGKFKIQPQSRLSSRKNKSLSKAKNPVSRGSNRTLFALETFEVQPLKVLVKVSSLMQRFKLFMSYKFGHVLYY